MSDVEVRFWGVRGSIPTPGRATARYGGNTSCVEVACGAERLILDMGTGLRALGQSLRPSRDLRATFLLSHYHWDHIMGLPFFGPAYDPSAALTMYGAPRQGLEVRDILAGQMTEPYFPVSLSAMRARLEFRPVRDGDAFEVGPFRIVARELFHPGGVLGYRIEASGRVVVYATDFEHGTSSDEVLVELARDADVLIYDATYTVPEYEHHKGWGHSTWEQAIRLGRKAGVGRISLFHHDPAHDDAAIDHIVGLARAQHRACDGAREGRGYLLPAQSKAIRTWPVRSSTPARVRGGGPSRPAS